MPKKKKASTTNDELKKKLEDTINEVRKQFGEGSIMRLNEMQNTDVDSIPTGSLSLDLALGIGGVPKGRVVEIFGGASAGKTTLSLHIISSAQKEGKVGAFIDVENALDPQYAKRIGVNIEDLLISQPDSGEQALQIVETLVRSEEVDVVVVDSVAALAPKAEITGEIGDQHIGLQARLMSSALRKLSKIISETGTVVVFINQTRVNIGQRFGNPQVTSGGLALKFYSSVRINLAHIAQIKSKEEIVGSRIRAKVVKNKVGPPFRDGEFDIYYNEGISKEGELINMGVKEKVITRSGSFYSYGDKKLGQGVDQSKKLLKENPELMKKLEKDIREELKKKELL
ncbi:MAG: recombinase RecA [Candidatus Pacebacteria bacterium]|nr:recombinase RecA [Candidatus Paceibacterota bacterium]